MNYDEDDFSGGGALGSNNPFGFSDPPSWSFNRVTDTHQGFSQMTTELPGSLSDDDFLNDESDDSNQAVGGGDISDADVRMASLADSPPFQGPVFPGTPLEGQEPTKVTELPQPAADADDDELPVVELHVGEEERLD